MSHQIILDDGHVGLAAGVVKVIAMVIGAFVGQTIRIRFDRSELAEDEEDTIDAIAVVLRAWLHVRRAHICV